MASKTDQALKAARRFVRSIQKHGIDLDAAYLYGSFAVGRAHADSDIDVALISKDLTGGIDDLEKIGGAFFKGDHRIETVRFHPRKFRDENPLVWEIKQQGIPLLSAAKTGKMSFAPRERTRTPRLNINSIVNYWLKDARFDWRMASDFFENKHYRYCLTFARLYLEKMLKAVIVRQRRTHAPYRLPLQELARGTGIEFNPSQLRLFRRAEQYKMDNVDDPDNESLRQSLTRKFCKQELEAIRNTGKYLQTLAK